MATRPDRDLEELIAELAQAQERAQAIYAKLRNARDTTLPRIGRTDDGALIVAGYLETYYTARIDFLLATLDAAHPSVLADLQAFDTFLRAVNDHAGSG